MDRKTKPEQLELELTEEEEMQGAPTLPLSHVLHVADELAEHDDEEEL